MNKAKYYHSRMMNSYIEGKTTEKMLAVRSILNSKKLKMYKYNVKFITFFESYEKTINNSRKPYIFPHKDDHEIWRYYI